MIKKSRESNHTIRMEKFYNDIRITALVIEDDIEDDMNDPRDDPRDDLECCKYRITYNKEL